MSVSKARMGGVITFVGRLAPWRWLYSRSSTANSFVGLITSPTSQQWPKDTTWIRLSLYTLYLYLLFSCGRPRTDSTHREEPGLCLWPPVYSSNRQLPSNLIKATQLVEIPLLRINEPNRSSSLNRYTDSQLSLGIETDDCRF